MDVISLGAKHGMEIRFVIPRACLGLDEESLHSPLKKMDFMLYCWPAKDRMTTGLLNRALQTGDQDAILSVQDKIGWFDFRCEKYKYAQFWKKFPDELLEFEESAPGDQLHAMRSATTRYFFRCGLRPKQNARYLEEVARFIRDETSGCIAEC
jgi:hypothetical protein